TGTLPSSGDSRRLFLHDPIAKEMPGLRKARRSRSQAFLFQPVPRSRPAEMAGRRLCPARTARSAGYGQRGLNPGLQSPHTFAMGPAPIARRPETADAEAMPR